MLCYKKTVSTGTSLCQDHQKKAQGSTLKNVIVDLDTTKQEHMHYVALS